MGERRLGRGVPPLFLAKANALQALVKTAALPIPDPRITAAARLLETLRPNESVSRQVTAVFQALDEQLSPFRETLSWVVKETAKCERLEEAGWLPHWSSPFEALEATALDAEAVHALVADHYRSEWPSLAAEFDRRGQGYSIDDEAKAAFREGLVAHGTGLFRCAPRLLFPELERVARSALHGGALDRVASQARLREAIGSLTPADLSDSGVYGLRLYGKLTEHLYENVKDDAALARVQADPVPNRHAAVHGLVAYNSAKSSMNAIIMADYLFQAISTLKAYDGSHPPEGSSDAG